MGFYIQKHKLSLGSNYPLSPKCVAHNLDEITPPKSPPRNPPKSSPKHDLGGFWEESGSAALAILLFGTKEELTQSQASQYYILGILLGSFGSSFTLKTTFFSSSTATLLPTPPKILPNHVWEEIWEIWEDFWEEIWEEVLGGVISSRLWATHFGLNG